MTTLSGCHYGRQLNMNWPCSSIYRIRKTKNASTGHTLKGTNMTCKEKLRIATEKLEEHIYSMDLIEERIEDVTAKLAGINALIRAIKWNHEKKVDDTRT
jgi:hypothetical protein